MTPYKREKLISSVLKSALSKEIFKIRVDTLWKMLYLEESGMIPSPLQEGATGRFDNKGAIFVPGDFVVEDSDKRLLRDTGSKRMSKESFLKQIRQALNYDNATLIYPKSVKYGINLPNEFFIETSSNILSVKDIVSNPKLEKPIKFFSDNVTANLTPNYMFPPFGTRTKVSSCLSVCVSNPRFYYLFCREKYGVRLLERENIWKRFKTGLRKVRSNDKETLSLPIVTVLQDTRYLESNYVGVTRFLSIKGDYSSAALTFEKVTKDLLKELHSSSEEFNDSKVLVSYNNNVVTPIIRFYGEKNRVTISVSPANDLQLDLAEIHEDAKSFYRQRVLVSR